MSPRASRHARWEVAGGAASEGFNPSALSAVSSWFRLASPSSVITGAGYSSVADVLNPSNPAVQVTDARRPVPGTSANGLPIMVCNTSVLTANLAAANNGTAAWGFWYWARSTSASTNTFLCQRALSGASLNKAQIRRESGDKNVFWLTDPTSRKGVAPGTLWTLNTWGFFLHMFDGTGATEADRVFIYKGGTKQTLTFGNNDGAPGDSPTALRAPTGTFTLFSENTSGGNSVIGEIGPNFGFLGSKMAGAVDGLLTPAAIANLMNFEAPT